MEAPNQELPLSEIQKRVVRDASIFLESFYTYCYVTSLQSSEKFHLVLKFTVLHDRPSEKEKKSTGTVATVNFKTELASS